MSDELKPCPFCGKSARIWQDPSHSAAFFIGCDDGETDCFGAIMWAESKPETITAWNRRADLAQAPVPVRCAECDCEKGAEECTWIKSSPALEAPDAGVVAELVDAAKALRDDMLERSRAGIDAIHGDEYRIVNAGRTAWADFCAALAKLETRA